MSTPRRVGVDILFTAVGVGVSVGVTPITKGPPAQICLGGMLLVSAMTFTLGLKVKLLERFLLLCVFSLFYQKEEGDFDQTWQEAS